MQDHEVQFYESEFFLVSKMLEFVKPALLGREGALVIATKEHADALTKMLIADGMSDRLDACSLLDAREVLSAFMIDGRPDEARFQSVVGGMLDRVSRNSNIPTRAFGEMVALLYRDGNPGAALQLELFWTRLAPRHRFSLLCAYPMQLFVGAAHGRRFKCICDLHGAVFVNGCSAAGRPDTGALDSIASSTESPAFDLMTVESVANALRLTRPHVVKLLADGRFIGVVYRKGLLPLIPSSEVARVRAEMERSRRH